MLSATLIVAVFGMLMVLCVVDPDFYQAVRLAKIEAGNATLYNALRDFYELVDESIRVTCLEFKFN
jgi:hypothetical protein